MAIVNYMMYFLIAIIVLLVVLIFLSIDIRRKGSKVSLDSESIMVLKDSIRTEFVIELERQIRTLNETMQGILMKNEKLKEDVNSTLTLINKSQKEQLETIFKQISGMDKSQSEQISKMQSLMIENLDRVRKANSEAFAEIVDKNNSLIVQNKEGFEKFRIENSQKLEKMHEMILDSLEKVRKTNSEAFADISTKTEKLTAQIRVDMDKIRNENNIKLDQMRATVDEKLQQTLDQRISKSFKEVTENLSKLYESLGSLNTLTADVGNINKIFSNVKARGIWGEVQAKNILDDILTSDQYVVDYSPRGNSEHVEFAIKLPGKDGSDSVYLPIDSKFPVSAYIEYKEALDNHEDEKKIDLALKALKEIIQKEAKDIAKKYIVTPATTDFAILFVPAESIYIEMLRMPEFVDKIQNEQRVILTGPNNFAALLNSLRLGFKTLQIEKYTSQIWHSFESLKKQFGDLSKAIDASKKAVDKASTELESATKKKDKLSTVLIQMEATADKSRFLSDDVEDAKYISSDDEC